MAIKIIRDIEVFLRLKKKVLKYELQNILCVLDERAAGQVKPIGRYRVPRMN